MQPLNDTHLHGLLLAVETIVHRENSTPGLKLLTMVLTEILTSEENLKFTRIFQEQLVKMDEDLKGKYAPSK